MAYPLCTFSPNEFVELNGQCIGSVEGVNQMIFVERKKGAPIPKKGDILLSTKKHKFLVDDVIPLDVQGSPIPFTTKGLPILNFKIKSDKCTLDEWTKMFKGREKIDLDSETCQKYAVAVCYSPYN